MLNSILQCSERDFGHLYYVVDAWKSKREIDVSLFGQVNTVMTEEGDELCVSCHSSEWQ